MQVLFSLLIAMLEKFVPSISSKAIDLIGDAVIVAVAAGCGLGLWYGTTAIAKVMAAVLLADGIAGYLAFTGRLPGLK